VSTFHIICTSKILLEMKGFIKKNATEFSAFDKPQATITEEKPEANTPNEGTVAEVELTGRGELCFLFTWILIGNHSG